MSGAQSTSAGDARVTILPPRRRLLVTVVVIAATVVVILDTTIANVALPHMQASLGATPDSISWVLTSYILATAVTMPAIGFLSDRLGTRTLFTGALVGFTLSSMICGIAVSLPMMVAARVLQGLFGAFLAPMSQAIMYDINPPENHARAMTIWGVVIMVAPIMGPVLGGWITDNFDWRWLFYINVPIGVAAAAGSWALLDDGGIRAHRFDIFGFILLALALSALQLILDRGSLLDWFSSNEIWVELAITLGASWMFVVHVATRRDSLLPPGLFGDRNFTAAVIAIAVIGGTSTAGAALVAPMLQRLFGYPVLQAGLLTAPRGIGTLIGMIVAGRLRKWVDTRLMIMTGLAILGASLWMMTGFTLEMDSRPIVTSGFIQGLGLGAVALPLNLLALGTLPQRLRTEAASLYNLSRSIGGSICISVSSALIARNVQVTHESLGAHLTSARLPLLSPGMIERLGADSVTVMQYLDAQLNRQSLMIAYVDDYWLMMWAVIALMPLMLLMRVTKDDMGDLVPDAH